MNYIFQLRCRNIDGVLERVLGVARLRGCPVQNMVANPTPDGQGLDVTLKVHGGQASRLDRHLANLYDVQGLEVYGELKQAAAGG